ncbi:hypothetical protein niasHS_004312 [Heterodera schachtii]|uniref:Protein kinase domain-containing protein n=1 Tax=Heterodera schachtii TaxID=97005 RepID=A0ABD2JUU1_HETSC
MRRQWENKFARLAKTSRKLLRSNKAATASHEIGHAVIIWLLGVRQFWKATIVKKGGDLGYTLHSGPSSYTRTGLKHLMVIAAAGRVAELRAVGHSTGWQQDEKDWRRAATMYVRTSARWAELESEEEREEYQRKEIKRLERWAIRTAEEMLGARWQDVLRLCELLVREKTAGPAELRETTPERPDTEVKAVGHSTGWEEDEKDWRRVAKKATIVKKGGDLGFTLHSGPSSYTRTGLKQLMVVATAGRVAELKAFGHSIGWQQDEKDWRRAAIMKLTDFGLSKRDVHGQLRTILGTPAFMAPEVRAGKYTMSADVFSLGSIFFLLLTRKYLPGANQMAMPSPADEQQQQKRMGNRIQQKQQQLQQQYLDLECIWNNVWSKNESVRALYPPTVHASLKSFMVGLLCREDNRIITQPAEVAPAVVGIPKLTRTPDNFEHAHTAIPSSSTRTATATASLMDSGRPMAVASTRARQPHSVRFEPN